jgi:iron complex transport system substrate-binding protein
MFLARCAALLLAALALAPDTLIGWTRGFHETEAQWVPEKYARLPELGRLTGRGNTANVEVVLKEKPDLIIDVGSTTDTGEPGVATR